MGGVPGSGFTIVTLWGPLVAPRPARRRAARRSRCRATHRTGAGTPGRVALGIALFRTHVLAGWAAILLAVSTVATAALVVPPDSFSRPLAVPEGIALIALGVSLWRKAPPTSPADTSATVAPRSPAHEPICR